MITFLPHKIPTLPFHHIHPVADYFTELHGQKDSALPASEQQSSIICLGCPLPVGDTTYYDNDDNKVSTLKLADYYTISKKDVNDNSKITERTYFKSGQIKSEINYKAGLLNGQVLTYFENGKIKRKDNFENGKLIDGKCFNDDGNEIPHFEYKISPEFRGGLNALYKFLRNEIEYPKMEKNAGITGRVYIEFFVEKDGKISNVKEKRGIAGGAGLTAEGIRVIKLMPKWKPGMQEGKVAKMQMVLPINFSLK